jgi:hypothetical protein
VTVSLPDMLADVVVARSSLAKLSRPTTTDARVSFAELAVVLLLAAFVECSLLLVPVFRKPEDELLASLFDTPEAWVMPLAFDEDAMQL